MTEYQASLWKLENKVLLLEQDSPLEGVRCSPSERLVRLFACRFQVLSLAGDLPGCAQLDRDIAEAIGMAAADHDLWLLRACIALKLHRLQDAEAFLRVDPLIDSSLQGRLLQADLDLQHGRYDAARNALERMLEDNPTWDTFARLAHITGLHGDIEAADQLYEAAEDDLTAKQMHLFAWLETQRGFMRFERGQYEEAERRYERADAAFPGYWLVQQRLAELHGAQGRFAEAVATYNALYEESPRGEWAHALGDLHALAGDPPHAHVWRERALAQYQQLTDAGEVYPYHLLVDLCCELPGRTGKAVVWARKDVAIRRNHATLGDLAWALYRNGDIQDSYEQIQQALCWGIESARLFVQTACIFAANGKNEESAEWMRRARAINPKPPHARFSMRRTKLSFAAMASATGVPATVPLP